MIIRRLHGVGGWIKEHHKRMLVIGIGGFVLLLTIVQFRYPPDLLLPFTEVDGISFGVQSKTAAILKLDDKYSEKTVGLYFGSGDEAYRSPKPSDIGIHVENKDRINTMDYPWYLRLAPGSILWGHFVVQPNEPDYKHDSSVLDFYIGNEFGESCNITPQNANLKVVDNAIKVINGAPGGTCEIPDLTKTLGLVKPSIETDVKVKLPIKEIPADVSDANAEAMASNITTGIEAGVEVKANQELVLIPRGKLIDWIDFTITEGQLDYSFNIDRSSEYLNEQFASKVAKPAGITTINTYNFAETSRVTGASGQTLDIAGTLNRIKSFVNTELEELTVATSLVSPAVQYTRAYSNNNVGLSALMQNFADTHSGTYGVMLTELSGQYRRATYNASKSYTTASTYKLFVAYSVLKRVESGVWNWTDQIHGGRDLAKCFDDMIVLSDNACAETLELKVGNSNLTNEARAIGCVNTSFIGSGGIKTTAEDLALLLASLQTGQILNGQTNRDILINAMKRNIYRQGIPKGINATVANKVGFLEGWLHDAAIVYSTSGPYVLVIMTEGSSWANIAELTRQIEELRLQ